MDDLIVFLLDKSASMEHLTNDTIGGFNKFLKEQKVLPSDARMTLILFATESELLYDVRDLQSIPELNSKLYVADGFSTAYLDAIGHAIDNTGMYLDKMSEHEKPKNVVFVVLTDGLENASKRFTKPDVLQKITHQTQKYNWKFIFLGANMDAVEEGKSMGISSKYSSNFTADSNGVSNAFTRTNEMVSYSRT